MASDRAAPTGRSKMVPTSRTKEEEKIDETLKDLLRELPSQEKPNIIKLINRRLSQPRRASISDVWYRSPKGRRSRTNTFSKKEEEKGTEDGISTEVDDMLGTEPNVRHDSGFGPSDKSSSERGDGSEYFSDDETSEDSSVQKYKAKRRFSYDALPNLQLKLEEVVIQYDPIYDEGEESDDGSGSRRQSVTGDVSDQTVQSYGEGMNPFVDDGMSPFMEDIALTDDDNDADEDYDDLPGQQLSTIMEGSKEGLDTLSDPPGAGAGRSQPQSL